MAIHWTTGNLLDAKVDALVNAVNTVGIMGKGIALAFKKAFPENFLAYQTACRNGTLQPGTVFVFPTGATTGPRFVINFPTKRHWRSQARLADIESGLIALVAEVKRHGITSLAIPPLGCGNGGLDWEIVRPYIEQAFAPLPEVAVSVFVPYSTRQPVPKDNVEQAQSVST